MESIFSLLWFGIFIRAVPLRFRNKNIYVCTVLVCWFQMFTRLTITKLLRSGSVCLSSKCSDLQFRMFEVPVIYGGKKIRTR
jgi:hypothetical protein